METPGFIDSKFRLAILAAKRAKQLVHGAKKRLDMNAENPLTVALEEIYQGKISFQIFSEEELALSKQGPLTEEEEDILEALEGTKSEEVDEDEELDLDEEDEDAEEDDDDEEDDDEEVDEDEDKDDEKDDK